MGYPHFLETGVNQLAMRKGRGRLCLLCLLRVLLIKHRRYDKNSIIAGASGVNEVRVFGGEGNRHETGVKIFDIKQGCYSVDSSFKSSSICFVTAKQGFFVYNYGKS